MSRVGGLYSTEMSVSTSTPRQGARFPAGSPAFRQEGRLIFGQFFTAESSAFNRLKRAGGCLIDSFDDFG